MWCWFHPARAASSVCGPRTADKLPEDIAADIEASRQELDLSVGVDYERTMEVGWHP